jgi:hypothetical protein
VSDLSGKGELDLGGNGRHWVERRMATLLLDLCLLSPSKG